jgi:hypothetical protein
VNPKTKPLVLAIFILLFALPAAAGAAIPPAIAQEDDASLGEDLAGGILSDVLDGVGGHDYEVNDDAETRQDPTNAETVNPNQEDNNDVQFGGDTNTQIAIPIIDQDQGAANLAANLATNLDIEDIEEEEEKVPPECPPGFALEANGDCRSIETTEPICPTGFALEANGDCRSIETTEPT